ncbi:MAG: nucleotide sugar dehydrogenase [Bacteroidales bacterium]|nr:nucleotide sugar dehydrogenase [Bacteroidales bacterium]
MNFDDLLNGKTSISVIGLGYVGLPIALEFAKHVKVIGFDINPKKVELLKKGIDPNKEIDAEEFKGRNILFTSDPENIKNATFHIIAVPTPVDNHNNPDIRLLLKASEITARNLKKGDIVVFESTVYPGCTEEDCVPVLEKYSNLKYKEDFKVGYSPERINPGDKEHSLPNVVKVVSACDDETLEIVAKVYSLVVKAGIHKAPSIKVAEAAKIIENTQRDVNIALINELSIIFNRMGINTYDVLEAASTKWNFLKFYPGLVGGHCIGVDPYYLAYKAREYRYYPQVINSGRFVNDSMGFYVAKQTVKKLIAANKNVLNSKVLIYGITFKEDIADIRNSKVVDIYRELQSYGVKVDIIDPNASIEDVLHEYNIKMIEKPAGKYDAVIFAVAHKQFKSMQKEDIESLLNENGILIDIKGIFRKINFNVTYWSL